MDRRKFIKLVGSSTLLMSLGVRAKDKKMKMPTLFLGHGSPMNALADNDFTKSLQAISNKVGSPKAILIISAHWETNGTWVTSMENPKTIHDFYGFPKPLFDIQYPAKGDVELAKNVHSHIVNPKIHLDEKWGLDHGTWSVLKHMYPKANIPLVQLSIDRNQPFNYHFELGTQLRFLRKQGVLIVGSGNITHNLRRISWEENAPITGWAKEFDEWVKRKSVERDFKSLVNDPLKSEAGKLSIPTPEHYLPLLYILGASDVKDELTFDIEEFQNASLSMRSFRFS